MAAKWLGMGFEMIGGNLVLLLQFFFSVVVVVRSFYTCYRSLVGGLLDL